MIRNLYKSNRILFICVAAVVAAATISGMWVLLGWYISPETPTDRKDHVQVMAVGLGAVGAIITAIIGWRNLKESQRSTETTIQNTREIEQDRAQNDALEKYLEQMGHLLTNEGLRSSKEGADVRILARSQTLTVLKGLSPDRKQILLRFLYESHLISGDDTIVSLIGAHLNDVDLYGAHLQGANLSEAKLQEANLNSANLRTATSLKAKMSRAHLSEARLIGTHLSEADLSEANLGAADLREAILQEANLNGANLEGANLHKADLREADLERANLLGANLLGAKLLGANLRGAKLDRADLRGTRITQKQLDACRSSIGATMPSGSRYA